MPAQLPPALHGLPHGVYENSGIAVRIPPERVYEISRNQHLTAGTRSGIPASDAPPIDERDDEPDDSNANKRPSSHKVAPNQQTQSEDQNEHGHQIDGEAAGWRG
jgi:hypothetical protein